LVSPIFNRIVVLTFCVFILSACETNLADDELRIVNNLPKAMFYYIPVNAPIEIAGGAGAYSVRYIQNPEPGMTEEEVEDVAESNLIKLTVQKEKSAKNTFRLTGTPLPFSGEDSSQVITDPGGKSGTYWIEYSDGSQTKRERVDFKISQPAISTSAFTAVAKEGESNLREFDSAVSRNVPLCDGAKDSRPEVYDSQYGKIYPVSLLLGLERAVSTRVTFEYEITSDYDVSGSENSPQNKRKARPWVDFIPVESRKFTLEPGQLGCPIIVETLDDSAIEETENIVLNVLSINGVEAPVDSIQGKVSLNDSEPKVNPFSGSYLINPGESKDIKVTISPLPTRTVFLSVNLNEDLTTASSGEFSILPASRVLTFASGQSEAILTVRADAIDPSSSQDKKVVITDELSGANNDEAVVVTINGWNSDVVVSSESGYEFVDISQSQDSPVFSVANFIDGVEKKVMITAFDSLGASFELNSLDSYVISKTGVGIEAVGLTSRDVGTYTEVSVILEVEGTFGNVNWGGRDFAIVRLSVDSSGSVVELGRSQHGSELDDTVSNIVQTENAEVYVSGTTDGRTLDGAAVFSPSNGDEGFIYALVQDLSAVRWARFIGTNQNNSVASLDGNSANVHALVTDASQAFVRTLDNGPNSIGDNDLDFDEFPLGYSSPVNWSSIAEYDGGRLFALADSAANLQSGSGDTASLSKDVFVLSFAADAVVDFPPAYSLATDRDDVGVEMNLIESQEVLGVVGNTLGQFPESLVRGSSDNWDVFFSSLDFSGGVVLSSPAQFGTPGDDYAVSLEPIGNEKFLVLWKENHTSGDGSFRYRISAFSKDGRKLTPDL
jgi:hypothetical protein